jgi:hypothetical protein
MKLTDEEATALVRKIHKGIKYDENKHPSMLLKIMADPAKSRLSAFCAEALIGEDQFYRWMHNDELFLQCYALGKILSRENWERQGIELKDLLTPPGTISHAFEYWKMVGWSRFGIGKTCKIKLNLDPDAKPTAHYAQLIKQANAGEFTASEIKQLMEALSLGLKTQQTVELQKEIDDLKADLATMAENNHADNRFTDKRTA